MVNCPNNASVHNVKLWGMAASFLAAVLAAHCAGMVPDVIAWKTEGDTTFTLFRKFEGELVQTVNTVEAAVGMARTLAVIQNRMMEISPPPIPRYKIRDTPTLLDGLLADCRQTYVAYWQEDEAAGKLEFPIPLNLIEQVEAYRPQLFHWAEEVAARCPLSIDHVDFLGHNGIVKPNGDILIYDWEQAVWSCPLYSIDVFFLYVQQIETAREEYEIQLERHTAATQAVRKAYLDAVGWANEDLFERALCLSPIHYAAIEQHWARQTGYERSWARIMAWWLLRGLQRWQVLHP